MTTPKRGLFQRLRIAVSGERDAIDQQLDALAHQGAGMARLAHFCATLLVVLFSAGSFVALGSDALASILTQWNHSRTLDIPSTITVCVTTLMVLAMDVAMLSAAASLRLLASRRARVREMLVHVAVMAGVCVLESGTYLYMSWTYEHPATTAAGALIVARSVSAPILAVYLASRRVLPITSRDILAQAELAAGRGVLREVSETAKDQDAPLEQKMRLYSASAIMTVEDKARLDGMITAVRQAQTFLLTGTVPPDGGPGSGEPLPEVDESTIVDADREPFPEQAKSGAGLRIIRGKGRSRTKNGNGSRNTGRKTSAMSRYEKQEAIGFAFLDAHPGTTRTGLQVELHCRPDTAQKILNRWRYAQRQKA